MSKYSEVAISVYVTNNGYYATPDIYLDNVFYKKISGSGYRYDIRVDVKSASSIRIVSTWGACNAGVATVGTIYAI